MLRKQNAIVIYLRRWEIESLFQRLKSRGFHFEDKHITALYRLEKLVAFLAIGFVWCHKIGEWRSTIIPIIWKQFKDQKRPQCSYFRYGLDFFRELIINQSNKTIQLRYCLALIYPVNGDNL